MVKKLIKYCLKKRALRKFTKGRKALQMENQSVLEKNVTLNYSANKERCFIIGNGPSTKEVDFRLLKDEDVITVNQISRNPDFKELNIKYHFWCDPAFFAEDEDHNITVDDELLDYMYRIPENNPHAIAFVNRTFSNGVVRELAKRMEVRYYCFYKFFKDFPESFDVGLDKPSPAFHNVVQYATYSALCLGYKKIYLIGSEQTGIINTLNLLYEKTGNDASMQYSYSVSEKEAERMKKLMSQNTVSAYFQIYHEMFSDFERLNRLSTKLGAKIYNCTPKSLVDCFQFVDLQDVLNS